MHPGIVSASDAAYFQRLLGLLQSIRDCRPEAPAGAQIAIGVLDVGLEPKQIATLQAMQVRVVAAEWDFDFPARTTAPTWFRAMTGRCHLPKFFPDFDPIVWIDADAWLQDWRALELLLAAAKRGNHLVLVPEINRAYQHIYQIGRWNHDGLFDTYRKSFDKEAALYLASSPVMNSGVVAARSDADIWRVWTKWMGIALNGQANFMTEQSALNAAIHLDNQKFYPLPGWCNWHCGQAAPVYDAANRRLVEPLLPHAPISIVHATPAANAVMDLATLDGQQIRLPMQYHAFKAVLKAWCPALAER